MKGDQNGNKKIRKNRKLEKILYLRMLQLMLKCFSQTDILNKYINFPFATQHLLIIRLSHCLIIFWLHSIKRAVVTNMHNKPQDDSEHFIVQPSHSLFLEAEIWIPLNQRRNSWQDTIYNSNNWSPRLMGCFSLHPAAQCGSIQASSSTENNLAM